MLARGKGERDRCEKETLVSWLPSIRAPAVDQTRHPGMCPHWELNRQPFGAQDNTQLTEPNWLA